MRPPLIICFATCIYFLLSFTVRCQYRDSAGQSVPVSAMAFPHEEISNVEVPAGTKLLYLGGAVLGFSLFDYVGFNLVRYSDALPAYRVLQTLVQAGITWFLYEQVGLPTAIAFNVIWWSWGADVAYYGWTELFNAGGTWERRGAFQKQIMENHCTWAWWTAVGVARGMKRDEVIAGDTLVAQSLIGAALAVTITLTF